MSALSDFIARRIAAIFHFYCDHHTDQHFSITAFFYTILYLIRLRYCSAHSIYLYISFSTALFPICIRMDLYCSLSPSLSLSFCLNVCLSIRISVHKFTCPTFILRLLSYIFVAHRSTLIWMQIHFKNTFNDSLFSASPEKFRIPFFFICWRVSFFSSSIAYVHFCGYAMWKISM